MALPHENLNWYQAGEPATGTTNPSLPLGVANRPLNELLLNDAYLRDVFLQTTIANAAAIISLQDIVAEKILAKL